MLTERLKEIRKLRSVSQSQVATALEINIRQYQRYELGENDPTSKVLIKLADYFNVSIDYLVGRSDNPKLHLKD